MEKTERQILKIGIVLSSVPGYSETFFRNKIKGLKAQGFEVKLFVDDQKDSVDFPCPVFVAPDFEANLIKTIFIGMRSFLRVLFSTPKRSLKLYRLDKIDGVPLNRRLKNMILNQFFLEHELDWLHFGFGMLANGRENVAKAMGAKMAVSFRGFDLYLSPLKHPNCYNILFKKEVRYHVLSQGMKQTLLDYNVGANEIHIITPAIDVAFFKADKESVASKRDVVNIVTVARLHWKKGLEYTLEALAILKQKSISFEYTIIGEGEEQERLIFAAHQLRILDRIHFAGKLSPQEVKEKLSNSDIYLQYSIQEGFCNAVLEAQSMGLTCIVSTAEGLDENVLHEITGYVVPKRQPQLLAQKIVEVIEMSETAKSEMQRVAIERIRAEFNLELQNAAFYNFYIK